MDSYGVSGRGVCVTTGEILNFLCYFSSSLNRPALFKICLIPSFLKHPLQKTVLSTLQF